MCETGPDLRKSVAVQRKMNELMTHLLLLLRGQRHRSIIDVGRLRIQLENGIGVHPKLVRYRDGYLDGLIISGQHINAACCEGG